MSAPVQSPETRNFKSAMRGRERPILFSGPMVRAILDGRKTQTRRVASKLNPAYLDMHCDSSKAGVRLAKENREAAAKMWSPFGQPGDRLWVRETAWYDEAFGGRVFYDDGMMRKRLGGGVVAAHGKASSESQKRRPSILMPRWASRLTLEITDVRIERLQQITDADAIAEGYESRAAFLSGDFASSLPHPTWLWCIAFSVLSPDAARADTGEST